MCGEHIWDRCYMEECEAVHRFACEYEEVQWHEQDYGELKVKWNIKSSDFIISTRPSSVIENNAIPD